MLNFTVDQRSQFYAVDGKRLNRGTWMPTYFAYIFGPEKNGQKIQWLVVGDKPTVEIAGQTIVLQPRLCPINGMEELEGPCVARKQYKCYKA